MLPYDVSIIHYWKLGIYVNGDNGVCLRPVIKTERLSEYFEFLNLLIEGKIVENSWQHLIDRQSNPAQVENAVRKTPSAIKLLTSLSLKASRRHCGGTEPPAMPPVQKVPRRSTMRREWDGGPRTSTFPVFQ